MNDLEHKNISATIAALKNEAQELVSYISQLYKERDEVQGQLATIKAEIEDLTLNSSEIIEQIHIEKQALADKQAALKAEQDTAKSTLTITREQQETLSLSLQGLMRNIEQATEQKTALQAEIGRLDILVKDKDTLLKQASKLAERVLDLQEQVIELQHGRDVLQAENTRLREKGQADLDKLAAEKEQVKTETDRLVQEAAQAKTHLEVFNNEYAVKKEDLDIIIRRIEEHWGKTFPELRLPL